MPGNSFIKFNDVPKGESPQSKRDHPDRQSRLWLSGCESTNDLQRKQGTLIDIADRGSDTFEFLEYEQRHGRGYVIRVARDRNLCGAVICNYYNIRDSH